jgi:hypothetical protein
LTLYRLKTWSHGSWHYCCNGEPPRFSTRRRAAMAFTRAEADKLSKRFRKGRARLALKLEEVAEAEARKASEPMSDKARKLLMFD